ncbi:MAG: hypothetical protein DCC68_07140 [Planctomycetota bacterium]|nr:MAG: hypothetical protein DCC68_07140 [Planctomycetota bacterium]
MNELSETIARLVREDPRYRAEAYYFVFESLGYAQRALGMGGGKRASRSREEADRHLTGQQLCEAIRQYALDQFGYMAKCVLNSWGVRTTGDFGEIVFNLIRVEQMRKTPQDKREDFDDNFDFDEAFLAGYRISLPD